jgi:hypothetical protein
MSVPFPQVRSPPPVTVGLIGMAVQWHRLLVLATLRVRCYANISLSILVLWTQWLFHYRRVHFVLLSQ